MKIDLTNTNASEVSAALVRARRAAGSPAMGMVLTLVVITDEATYYDAMKAASAISSEHPSRVLGVIRRSPRGGPALDAQVRVGNNTSGEAVLLRLSGELTKHAESVVLPLLLPDSPVVVWWPGQAPDNPADDPLGALAQRRLTDAAAARSKSAALHTVARNYTAGDTDLAWTRLTPWRALVAAALDQVDLKVTAGSVSAERGNPSAELMIAWLESRLSIPFQRKTSKGPGITDVRLRTAGGDVAVTRSDGTSATFTIPGEANRPVALKRRHLPELLAEDLRRLDEDNVYAATVRHLVEHTASGEPAKKSGRKPAARKPATGKATTGSRAKKAASPKSAAEKSTAMEPDA